MNTHVYQTRGGDVIFDCIVHSNPEPSIEWFRNGKKLIESDKYSFPDPVSFTNEFYYYRIYVYV